MLLLRSNYNYEAEVGSTAVTGNVTQREDFPEQDAVRPHVTLKGVDTVEYTLGRHPLNRQASLQEEEPQL